VNEPQTYLTAALAGGALRPLLPGWTVPPLPLHVVHPPNRHLSTRLRVFKDWTANVFAAADLAARQKGLIEI